MSSAEIVSSTLARERTTSMPLTKERPTFLQGHSGSHGSQGPGGDYGFGGRSLYGDGYDLGVPMRVPTVQPAHNFRVCLEHFSATVEYDTGVVHQFVSLLGSEHFFDPEMEAIDMVQLNDKFPELSNEYSHGPAHAFFLIKFWADMNYDSPDLSPYRGFYGHSARFHSMEHMQLLLTTRVFSLGKEIVSKDQLASPIPDGTMGGFLYLFERSAMCPYLVNFIDRLRSLDNPNYMNRVLEGFTVSQTARDARTGEILFSTAFMFDAASTGFGTGSQVFKLFDSASDMSRRFTA